MNSFFWSSFLLFEFFYWNLVDWQCCVSFSCTVKWFILYIYICIYIYACIYVCVCVYTLPGFSVHGILQTKIKWSGFHALLYGIFPTQELNLCLLHCKQIQWATKKAWWAAVLGVAKSGTRLSDFTFTFHFHALEKEMETHSSVLAWRIPGMVEPDGLPSMGLHRVGHDWSDLAAAAYIYIHIYIFQNSFPL